MSKHSDKFGTYYGEIVEVTPEQYENGDTDLLWNDNVETADVIAELHAAGTTTFMDVEDGDDYSATLFIVGSIGTDWKAVMLTLMRYRPDEFSEESENVFRAWFD